MTLHVERSGHGPALVLLHGWGMHSGVWQELLPRLATRFSVHAVDLPAHGHSPPPASASFDAAVDAVADAVPRGAVVCGWSLGGLAALALAARHPRSTKALALVSTTPCFVARTGWTEAMKPSTFDAFAADVQGSPDSALRDFLRLSSLGGARGRAAIRALTPRLDERGAPKREHLETGLRWLRDSDLREAVPRIGAKTVVIHGSRDAVVPIGAGCWLAAVVPRARLLELADCAHLPFFTHRDDFVRALEALVG